MKTDPKVSFTETHLDTVTNPYLSFPPTDPHRGHPPSLLQRRHQAMIPPIALGWFFQGRKAPGKTSLISGDQMETNENVRTSDSQRHRYAQKCLSSQFSGIPWKKNSKFLSRSWATHARNLTIRSYPQDSKSPAVSRGWFCLQTIKGQECRTHH